MLSVEQTIEKFTTEHGFSWGVNSVMEALRPNCIYGMTVSGGVFTIDTWGPNIQGFESAGNWSEKTQSYIKPPTEREIRDEYIRQQTIAECIEYFNNK